MELYRLIHEKLGQVDINELAGRLGYKPASRGVCRIETLIADQQLGVGKGGFDFKYSNQELLLRLDKLLGIDHDLAVEAIELIKAEWLMEERRFKPYIFVYTGFIMRGESIFAMAGASSLRNIRIDNEIGKLPLRQQLPHVRELVCRHYSKSYADGLPVGVLPVWGKIQNYIYNYNDLIALVLDSRGRVTGSQLGYWQ